jgi:glutathione S-transferase
MPKLVTAEVTIHGASVADEYVDERWPDPPLLTGSAAERAEARQWIDWLEEKLQPAYETALLEVEPARFDELRQNLDAVLRELEDRLQERKKAGRWSPGSYWHGERLGMVDLAYAATTMRFAGLRKFHRWEMPVGLPAVSAWIDTLGAEPIVQKTFFEERVLELVGRYREVLEALSKAQAAPAKDAEEDGGNGRTGS